MKTRWNIAGTTAGFVTGMLALMVYLLQSSASSNDVVPGLILYIASTLAIGYGYSWIVRTGTKRLTLSESIPVGVIVGGLAWAVFGLVVTPVLGGNGVQWEAQDAAAQFPLLVIYLLQGVLLALSLHVLQIMKMLSVIDGSPRVEDEMPEAKHHVVIIGGGFAGVEAAQKLEKQIGDARDIQVTLVSRTNHLLFTPMMAEVTAGGVEAQHIAPPLRAFFRDVRVIQGEPQKFQKDENRVVIRTGSGVITELEYDHLVMAVGSVPNYFGNDDLETHSVPFKSLEDTISIRSHVIKCLERADSEPDEARRRAMLTFVVVGAGYAGSELIGGLNDFVRGSLWYYRHIRNEEITMMLVHPGERILMELSEELALYAEEKMTARGVSILGGKRVTGAGPGMVKIGDETITAETLIWTAGNLPSPVLNMIGAEQNRRGALITDDKLRVKGERNIWAIGDCASIPDVLTEGTAPPTAQYAIREGKTLGYNLHAAIRGKELKVFSHRSQGQLAVVGHQTACAEVFGFKFSGLFAWLMWRGIYLTKLPTLEKKVRVLLDWIIDIFFPRDIAYAAPASMIDVSGERTEDIGENRQAEPQAIGD